MSLLESALDLVTTLAARALKLKRVLLPPKLEGPKHTYSIDLYSRGYNHCLKCGVYNPRRAAFTTPPCSEKLPPVKMELA